MTKTAIATSLVLFSGSVFADHCDVNFDGKLKLEDKVLTVTTEDNDKIEIDSQYVLSVNDSLIALDAEQQVWVEQYYNGIHDAAPKVAEIAVDGISLASEAITHVFGELLGEHNSAVSELTYKLEKMSEEIQYNFYAENGDIRLNSESFENGEFFGQQWEQEFEEAVEELVMSSMGRIMVAIGSEMILSGDMDAFEQKMENFASQIEQNVEFKGELLEEKANALCSQLVQVDRAERKLQKSVPELVSLDILSIKQNRYSM